jgi:hypothetical protein
MWIEASWVHAGVLPGALSGGGRRGSGARDASGANCGASIDAAGRCGPGNGWAAGGGQEVQDHQDPLQGSQAASRPGSSASGGLPGDLSADGLLSDSSDLPTGLCAREVLPAAPLPLIRDFGAQAMTWAAADFAG